MKSELTALRAPHVVRRLQLHEGLADDDADHVGRAEHEQCSERYGKRLRQSEHDGCGPEHGNGGKHRPSGSPCSGWCASHKAMPSAPTAVDERSKPSPQGPVCRISRA